MTLKQFLAAAALMCIPTAAMAQAERGASVSGAVSATSMDSRTELSFSGAFEYRFSRVVGFELEATVVPSLKSRFPVDDQYTILGVALPSVLIFPAPRFDNPGGRVVILSNNVRIVVPTTSSKLEPYFVAGGGIASTRRTADYTYDYGVYPPIMDLQALGLMPIPIRRTFVEHVKSSSIDLALTIGGGLSVRVARQMSVDADLRMFRLLGQTDRSTGRFGVGVRYSF